MKTALVKKVLPLIAVALVGVAMATSCEKEKNEEKVEYYTYQYDGDNYVNLTIYWNMEKYYTEVHRNTEYPKFQFNDKEWRKFKFEGNKIYVTDTDFVDGIDRPFIFEWAWELYHISDTVLRFKDTKVWPADGSVYVVTSYDFVNQKAL